jgi:hypothetical protein
MYEHFSTRAASQNVFVFQQGIAMAFPKILRLSPPQAGGSLRKSAKRKPACVSSPFSSPPAMLQNSILKESDN